MGWKCCDGDHGPFRSDPICPSCGDSRHVTLTRFTRRHDDVTKSDVRPCPSCSAGKFDSLMRGRRALPTITTRDLTQEEAAVVREWRLQGHHELDCLRWIEGRRYDPANDPYFRERCRIELAKWRLLSGKEETNR